MREIGILLYDGVQALDAVGPFEAFVSASNASPVPAYRLQMLSIDGRPVVSETGIRLCADAALGDIERLHTLLVPGGASARHQPPEAPLTAALKRLAARSERLVSVCTGAFLLAEAGLADGRRLATHWKFATDLAERFPGINVDAESLFIRDGEIFSSAGILAGIDLTLALIEADLGEVIAMSVARELVLYLRRSGGQAQFSEPLRVQGRLKGRLAILAEWIRSNLAGNLSVEALAIQASLSERHLRRLLQEEVGASPARFVENLRLDVARELLSAGKADIKQIAAAVGFSSDDIFRRAFRRKFNLSPGVYRERFQLSELTGSPHDCGRGSSSVTAIASHQAAAEC